MVNKTKIRTATVVFEDRRYPDVAITWAMGAHDLQLVTKDGATPAAVMRPVHLKDATMECAEAEAHNWFDALDIFEAPDVESADDDEHWY